MIVINLNCSLSLENVHLKVNGKSSKEEKTLDQIEPLKKSVLKHSVEKYKRFE